MKKILFLFIYLLSLKMAFTQWTTSGNDIYNSNTGNVGVGTTAPTSKLDTRISASSGTAGLKAGYFETESFISTTNGMIAVQGTTKFSHTSGTGNLMIGVSGIAFNNSSGSVSSMRAVQGNISLWGSGGTTNAVCFFGSIGTAGTGTATNAYGLYLTPFAPSISNKWGVYVEDGNAKNYFAGSLAIGTTNPGSFRLAVEGKIGAREVEVLVTTPFPDYVFHSGYPLMSIHSLDDYIKRNGRLPNMPSAEEIEKNGRLPLGDMNIRLVEKVEELTLYIIQLKKENDAIKEELKKVAASLINSPTKSIL